MQPGSDAIDIDDMYGGDREFDASYFGIFGPIVNIEEVITSVLYVSSVDWET